MNKIPVKIRDNACIHPILLPTCKHNWDNVCRMAYLFKFCPQQIRADPKEWNIGKHSIVSVETEPC